MVLLLILLNTVFASNAKYICTMDHYVNLEFNKIVFFESPDFPRIMTDDEIKQCFINFTQAVTTEKETKQFVIAISNSICNDDNPTGIDDCSSDYEVFTNRTSVFFDINEDSYIYNYVAFQGYAYFNDGDDNYPLESVSRVQPLQLTDITEIIEIRSTYPPNGNDAKPRNHSCIWQFKAPEDWGFKIFINELNLYNDTVFKVENSQEIIIETNGTSYVNLLHYSADNFIKIYLSETNFSPAGINYELSAYITIIKTLLNHVPINCSVTTNGSSIIWSYSNEFGIPNNAKCKYILKILPKTEREILVKLNKMKGEYNVDMIYYSYDNSISNGDDTIDFFNDYGHDYAFANDGKTEKEILFEFRSDGSIQSKAFEVEFKTKNCSCADSLITVPCTGVIQTYLMKSEIYSTDREFYCGNLECNFTIMLNSTCASQFILLSLSSDSNPAENDTFRIFSNGKTICDPYYPCRIPSSNHNIFQAITSSSSLVNARYLTIELSASNISTYLPTFVINETKPYYFYYPFFTDIRETPYMIFVKLSSELRQRNATIDVFFLNDDYDPYGIENDLGFYQDARLTNQIDFRNCFTAITDGVLKCKTNLKSVVFVLFDIMSLGKSFLFQVTEGDNIIGTEGCVFKNNVFYLNEFEHGEERHFSVMSNGKQKCRIFCYSAGPFIIQHIWISPNSNGTFSIFSGFKEKLLVNIDAKSASLWQNIIAVENIYVMEIPLNSLAMLTGHGNVPFEYPINITNKPYKTVLTTPFYGSSNIISDPDFYFYGFLMFNIFENKVQFTVLDTDFLLPNYFYFVLNKTTYINMTTNSILFGPFATVEIGCSCSSNVNCNIRMLLETQNYIEANTTTTLIPSTTTNALTTTNSLKATDQSFSFILTVNYFLLFTIGFI